MATPAQKLSGRALAIFNEVHARNGIWEAYDQGRMACAQGASRGSNPFDKPALTVNCDEWYRGYDAEKSLTHG